MVKLLRHLFWSAAIFAFVMAVLPHPPQVPGAPSDKMLHILAFTCLALLGAAAYPRLSELKLVIGLSAFGGLIELVQFIPSLHRDGNFVDWVVDTVTVIVIVAGVWWTRRRSMKRNDPVD